MGIRKEWAMRTKDTTSDDGGQILTGLREMGHEERFAEAQWLRENRGSLLAQGSHEGGIALQIAFLKDIKGVRHLMIAILKDKHVREL